MRSDSGGWKQTMIDALIRMRARPRIYATPFDRYRVSVARSVDDHREAFRLVHVAYAWLGIDTVGGETMRMLPQHVLPESTIFIARDEEDRLVGTMTATLDSPAGLPLDHDYPAELAALRRPEHRLVEYGALAVVPRCKHSGVTTLLTIAAHWFSRRYLGGTDAVVGVHPKVAPLYRALFNYRALGEEQQHAALEAPVLGMTHDMTTIEDWFAARFAGKSAAGLPFHRHFSDALPSCIEMPPGDDVPSLTRWKLSRAVFRRVFIEGSDRMRNLDARTRSQLRRWRSPRTIDDVPIAPRKELWAQ